MAPEDLELLCQVGVELPSSITPQFIEGFVKRQRLAVGAIRPHGREGISYCEDACSQRDVVSSDSVRVTVSVKPLVVMAYHIPGNWMEGNSRDDIGPNLRMLPYNFPFIVF